jgi:dipeptidyl aminopeptidase/acylaminoacyl peptidase
VAALGEQMIRRAARDSDASAELLVYSDVNDRSVARVDARTGKKERYRVALSGQVTHNVFDAKGRLRVVTTLESSVFKENGKLSHWYRSDDAAPWQLLESFGLVDDAWWPMGVLDAPDTLAILSRKDRDTWAIFRYDAAQRLRGEMMAGHPTEDIAHVIPDSDWLFASVVTGGLKPARHWFEPRMASLQASVDAALPGRLNTLSPIRGSRLLIFSRGDVDPGRWFLLDIEQQRLRELDSLRPQVDPARMRPQRTLTYAARDGLALHAYLSLPAEGAAPPPLVVLIHGGPQVRDRWEWDEEVQILATRGYAVFQPQFRGSTGFGKKYEEAGYRQWGRAMQDDITDGVRHLIAQGLVDPARVCISGASYGGYAALWGVIKTPELYRCGISFAGVTDLVDIASNSFFNDSTPASREIRRSHIGDPDKQRRELDEVSPVLHAAKAGAPLLILHGEDDLRVPVSHSRRMVSALEQNGKDVTWQPYPRAGHGLVYVSQKIHYYETVLAFLRKHIGGGAAAAARP